MVLLVSLFSFRWFRFVRFARFARFGGFVSLVLLVSLVSVVSFWSFRFVVSGFSKCLGKLMSTRHWFLKHFILKFSDYQSYECMRFTATIHEHRGDIRSDTPL